MPEINGFSKGDLVKKEWEVKIGETLAGNFSSLERAAAWKDSNIDPVLYNKVNVVKDTNTNTYAVLVLQPFPLIETGKVNWVVGDEMAITLSDGFHKIVEAKDYKIVRKAIASFQSSVAHMSEEELRNSLEALRAGRAGYKPKVRKSKAKVTREPVDKNDPLAKALAGLSEEKREALKKKLGMI